VSATMLMKISGDPAGNRTQMTGLEDRCFVR
jgi:hypothetical protein